MSTTVTTEATPEAAQNNRAHGAMRVLSRYGILIALIAMCIVMSLLSPYFLTVGNLSNVMLQISINGILAIGMTFVILAAGIDLSVGSVLALAGMVAASFVSGDTPHGVVWGIASGLAAGALCGAINGLVISAFKLPSFVVTLGMLSAARGAVQIWNDGMPIPGLSDSFLFIGTGRVVGVPMPVWLFLGLFVICWLALRYTRFGRHVYAVGGNEKSAKTSGIATRLVQFWVYTICGACAGLAGIVLTARTTSALTQSGIGYELDAIAAVVIGGTSLAGGVGSLAGTLFGVLIIGVINNGLDLLGVSSYYQQVIKGVVIVAAVLLDNVSRRDSR
jgi:putative xylitol transport system permease protein